MAYAALNSLKLTLNQFLMHPDRYSIPDHQQLMESLHEKLGYLLQFLEGLSFGQKSNQKTTRLEKRISDAACEAEDFIDLHLLAACEEEDTTDAKDAVNCSSFWFALKNCFLSLSAVLKMENLELHSHEKEFRRQVQKLESGVFQNIVEEIDSITEEVSNLKNKIGSDLVIEEADSEMEGVRETKKKFSPADSLKRYCNSSGAGSSNLASSGKNFMVGVEDLLMKIKEQLTGCTSKLKVVSIVGMGGIGKTTLATNVHTDLYIVDYFHICAWATVSASFSTRNVLLDILDSMKMLTDEIRQESDHRLRDYLHKTLTGMRYLITIDDIWDTNAWDDMKLMFPDDNNGSRIMLTTRQTCVAAYVSSLDYLHQMSLLSDDNSWTLLHAKVFGKEPCPDNLQELGKKIAKKCGGVPLSTVVIGGVLSKVNITQEAWRDIANNVSSLVTSSSVHCMEMVKLSYNYLPQHLKACFLYMGVFQEDHEILVSKLTKLWVAEGFLKEVPLQSLEEVAESCLKELVDRSLILISHQNSLGNIKTCRLHDLFRDFCVKEANKEKFLQVTNRHGNVISKFSHSQNHRSMHPTKIMDRVLSNAAPSISFARSFICMENQYFPSTLFPRFRLLRVLDASQVSFLVFPFEILKLLNLCYIAFKYKGEIPAKISMLWKLQTLIIHQSYRLFEKRIETYLPVELWMMPYLRHVHFVHAYYLDPAGVSLDICGKHLVLKELQSLSGISNLRFTEDMLRRIPNIKKLEISYDTLCMEKGWSYYHFRNIVNLNQLKKLKICVAPETIWKLKSIPRRLSFVFPPTLQRLTLSGCEIPWSDLDLVGSLPNLGVLKLRDHACRGKEWEPNVGEFCQLKVLMLEETDLKYWEADHDHFPSLEHLVIGYCYNLEKIPSGMGESPTLTTVELYNSNDSTWTSAQEILQNQRSSGNDGFQVLVHHTRRKKSTRSHVKMQRYNGERV